MIKRDTIKLKMLSGELANPYLIQQRDVNTEIDDQLCLVNPTDVGKLLYLRDGFIQIENEEQKDKRVA